MQAVGVVAQTLPLLEPPVVRAVAGMERLKQAAHPPLLQDRPTLVVVAVVVSTIHQVPPVVLASLLFATQCKE